MSTSTGEEGKANSSAGYSQDSKAEESDNVSKNETAAVRIEASIRPGTGHRARFDTSSTTLGPAPSSKTTRSKERHESTLPPLPSSTTTSQQKRTSAFLIILKRLLPCVISVFIGAIFVVNKHIAFLSGTADFAFLVIVIYTLFFHPAQHTVGKHVQVTGKWARAFTLQILHANLICLSVMFSNRNKRCRCRHWLVSFSLLHSLSVKYKSCYPSWGELCGVKSRLCALFGSHSLHSRRLQIKVSTPDNGLSAFGLYFHMATCRHYYRQTSETFPVDVWRAHAAYSRVVSSSRCQPLHFSACCTRCCLPQASRY